MHNTHNIRRREAPSPLFSLARALLRLHPRQQGRRGSVILLAVGSLAILAVLALSYMTVVRLDRSSSNAYQNSTNFQQQVNAVVNEIGAILTADLFGNKIVTNATPTRSVNATPGDPSASDIRPKMFEDGEYADYPSTTIIRATGGESTFNTADPSQPNPLPSRGSILRFNTNLTNRYQVAPSDDAWLAPTEPIDTDTDKLWDTWSQITNLRSAYRLIDTNQDNVIDSKDNWVRGDGRFVDLSRWFTRAIDNRGDPAADLSFDFNDFEFLRPSPPRPHQSNIGPWLGLDYKVYDHQMDEMFLASDEEPSPDLAVFNNIDNRRWVDTDGDQFPDARWQQLDALGDLFGLRWFVAARIIDNSALVNVNTATEFAGTGPGGFGPPNSKTIGDGLTPADVDLFRLLRTRVNKNNTTPGMGHPDVGVSKLDLGFKEHLINGLNIEAALLQIDTRQITGPAGTMKLKDELFEKVLDPQQLFTSNFNPQTPLSRAQREAIYRFFGSSPRQPVATLVNGYPLNDEVDLRAFWGFNYESILSRIEQRLDGPDNGPDARYLPGFKPFYPLLDSVGPMRSKEKTATARTFSESAVNLPGQAVSRYDRVEKIKRIMGDLRRKLTTVSGPGDFAPVPPINRDASFNNVFVNHKIRLDDTGIGAISAISANNRAKKAKAVQQAFGYLVWALAPFATDLALEPPLRDSDVGVTAARSDFHYGGGPDGPAKAIESGSGGSGPMKAAYAVLRAASLAVNLADATDKEPQGQLEHTIARLYPQNVVNVGGSVPGVIQLTTRFSHGDIPIDTDILPKNYVGLPDNGVTLVGLDRQPFLMEALSYAVYQDRNLVDGGLGDPSFVELNPGDPLEQMGSIIAVELGNPWPDPIDVGLYKVRLQSGGERITLRMGDTTGNAVIGAGQTAVFYFVQSNPALLAWWIDIENKWIGEMTTRIGGAANLQLLGSLDTSVAGATTVGTGDYVFFQSLDNSVTMSALLLYQDPALGDLLVDRLSPPNGATDPFPRVLPGGSYTFQTPVPFDPASLGGGNFGTGRVAVSSTLVRPNASPKVGFPAYVVERRANNVVANDQPEEQVWRLSGNPQPPLAPADIFVDALDNTGASSDANRIGDMNKTGAAPTDIPSFQLFVPDGPLATASEVGMISVFTHMYIHDTNKLVPQSANIIDSWVVNADKVTGKTFEPGKWITVSEQLGMDANVYYNGISGTPNPAFGVLDLSRFIPGGDLTSPVNTPESMRLPLAARVFDCFEALPQLDRLAQGRININTAATDTLRLLPLVAPEAPIGKLKQTPTGLGAFDRARLITDYRDTWANTVARRDTETGLTGLRNNPGNAFASRGYVATGEIPLLSKWDSATGKPESISTFADEYFAVLGQNTTNDNTDVSLDIRRSDNTQIVSGFDPIDDAEERLALYRAISNIVSTRSDVFTAWFVVRAYDPEAIEAVQVNRLNDTDLRDYFNQIRPAYDTRWLAVFDRSHVTRPTDRPRVLLLVELPPS